MKTKPDLSKLLTIYGRKPVLEALQNNALGLFKLHLSDSNKKAGIIDDIQKLAKKRNIEICFHNKLELSRISKNSQQDQGVALDIHLPGFMSDEQFLKSAPPAFQLIALDGITNPQNLGMIIRSVCASPATGLLLPEKGCAKLDSLVIKASAGTLFQCPIIRCKNLKESLDRFLSTGAEILVLDSHSATSLFDHQPGAKNVFVLGNETEGVSQEIKTLAQHAVCIPMRNGVESLNVAVTASLVAFSLC